MADTDNLHINIELGGAAEVVSDVYTKDLKAAAPKIDAVIARPPEIKIIALDMDGVVNSDILIRKWLDDKYKELEKGSSVDYMEIRNLVRKAFREEFRNMHECVFPELAARITQICTDTGAKIVWSSTWRTLPEYKHDMEFTKQMFTRRGLPADSLVGYTPQLGGDSWNSDVTRGSEIRAWIKNNGVGTVTKCAVIDDRFDAGVDLPACAKFFRTWETDGITEELMYKVISYLNN